MTPRCVELISEALDELRQSASLPRKERVGLLLEKIKKESGTAAALATNSQSFKDGQTLYQALFSSEGWGGEGVRIVGEATVEPGQAGGEEHE